MLIWNPFAGCWLCDRVNVEDCMLDQAHRLVSGAVVPRPTDVVSAVMLQAGRRLDELPLYAAETSVMAGTRLTPVQQRAVDSGALSENEGMGNLAAEPGRRATDPLATGSAVDLPQAAASARPDAPLCYLSRLAASSSVRLPSTTVALKGARSHQGSTRH
ncbi:MULTISPECIES: hypothetical protein [unclassified Streptomyces]|uniref:hypothetical protein n=1 Tax=unclassified Streptomyces TaxID=2593676 RepID=UPI00131CC3EB|nr:MULTISPECIES: hypothetical protein [unclassified Streptomyces]